MINSELLKGTMSTLVLKVLQHKQKYGYEIMKELEQISGGAFEVKEGTLYPILHALESSDAIESEWVQESGARKRKYYRLTRKGRTLLREKSSEWEQFRQFVDQVLTTELRGVSL